MTHHTSDVEGQKYLAFQLGAEEYGIDILKVQEIRGYERVTHIANLPAYIKGVIDLRGAIVPIVDLRLRFNLASAEYDHQTVVIVLNIGRRVIGLVVDRVSDVLELSSSQISPAPKLGGALKSDNLTGLGTVDGRMLILIDIEKLMAGDELGMLAQAA